MNKIKYIILGFMVGTVNALFGAGGGLIAVSAFKSKGLSQKNAQACAIAVILPLCLISSAVYAFRGYYKISDALPYLPFGLLGALSGTVIMEKLPDKILKRIFALFMVYTGMKMFTR